MVPRFAYRTFLRPFLTVFLAIALLATPALSDAATLDPGFGSGGRVMTALPRGPVNMAAARSEAGDLFVAKSTSVAGYLPDGRLNPAFGSAGIATIPLAADLFTPAGIEVDGEGRILVAGTVNSWSQLTYVPAGASSPVGREQAALIRLLADGRLDPSFGSGGVLITDLGFRRRSCTSRERTRSPRR
jgi:hypothetical protein